MRDLSRSVWVYKLSWVYKLCLGSQTYRVQRFSRKVGGGYYAAQIYTCLFYIFIYMFISDMYINLYGVLSREICDISI